MSAGTRICSKTFVPRGVGGPETAWGVASADTARDTTSHSTTGTCLRKSRRTTNRTTSRTTAGRTTRTTRGATEDSGQDSGRDTAQDSGQYTRRDASEYTAHDPSAGTSCRTSPRTSKDTRRFPARPLRSFPMSFPGSLHCLFRQPVPECPRGAVGTGIRGQGPGTRGWEIRMKSRLRSRMELSVPRRRF